MSLEKPWNDVADQQRPAHPDLDDELSGTVDDGVLGDTDSVSEVEPDDVIEADPADVADQRRVVPLPDDQP